MTSGGVGFLCSLTLRKAIPSLFHLGVLQTWHYIVHAQQHTPRRLRVHSSLLTKDSSAVALATVYIYCKCAFRFHSPSNALVSPTPQLPPEAQRREAGRGSGTAPLEDDPITLVPPLRRPYP